MTTLTAGHYHPVTVQDVVGAPVGPLDGRVAEAASEADDRPLGIPEHDPLLVERRVILDARGRPVEARASGPQVDRHTFDVRFDIERRTAAAVP